MVQPRATLTLDDIADNIVLRQYAALDEILATQGFAVRVRHTDIGTAAFPAAVARVLSNGSYAAAARKVSVKLRARKRTPVQEAVGASLAPLTLRCIVSSV